MKFVKPKSLVVIFSILGTLSLTSCSMGADKSQSAMIVFELDSTYILPITDTLEIRSNGSTDINISDIKNSNSENREISGEVKWAENFDLLPGCDGWIRECGTFNGVKFDQVGALDFYGEESFIQSNLDINDAGKAALTIVEQNRSATWEFEPNADTSQPIYLKILITDFYIAVTQLEQGFLTFTTSIPKIEDPEKSLGFTALFAYEGAKAFFQRPNPWVEFKGAYKKFEDVARDAEEEACEVFGKDCDGTASWSVIQEKNLKIYDERVSPMARDLESYTFGADAEVKKALLMLTQSADLLASCYFRTQLAAQSEDNTAYNATSSCFQDVEQKLGDIEIYLTDFNVQMNLVPRSGDY